MELMEIRQLIDEYNKLGQELHTLAARVAKEQTTETLGDIYAREYGEVVTKVKAGKILNATSPTIKAMVDRGELESSPDGRVVVRSMAAWVATSRTEKARIARRNVCV